MDDSFTPLDMQSCIRTLQAIVSDRKLLATLPNEQRIELLVAAGRVSRPERLEVMKMSKQYRRQRRAKERERDRVVRAETQIRHTRAMPVFVSPERRLAPAEAAAGGAIGCAVAAPGLTVPRHCYVCKEEFRRLHFFYDALCPSCAPFNYAKRFQSASVAGKTALITGARVKIGYQAALILLRAGARVLVTTRFPHDAATRFSQAEDFSQWSDRLQIHGLDLRHSPSVEVFTRFLDHSLDRLDILINNAAQTVRRPPGFYRHLLDLEAAPTKTLPPPVRELLRDHETCKRALQGARSLESGPKDVDNTGLAAWHAGGTGVGITASAALSQVRYAYGDNICGEEVFPIGQTDADLQQVDLREMNSWRLALADVPTPEMIEVQLVNSVAPFILCSKLKPLMLRTPNRDKHIVNVSAMEGKFSRNTKTDKHPHTNMAKAALNMLTLTSARDYVRDGIFMNAVDTGWVTDEDPMTLSLRKQEEHDFQPPLDIIDGAARICDPFFSGLLTGEHVWGKFLKDYFPTPW